MAEATSARAPHGETAAPATARTRLDVSVLMPCLNESRTIGACVDQALAALRVAGVEGEVVVADNGSTDGSQELATEHGARVVPVADRGYGSALRGGIEAAEGEYVLMGDADGSYDFGHLPRFLERLREGYDLVLGNRFRGGIQEGAMPFLHRRLGNPVLTWLTKRFFRTPCGDVHCGLRAFRRSSVQGLDLRTGGMEFATEMVVKASLHGLRVTEVPTTLAPDARDREPHLRTWRDGWRHLRFMLLYSPAWLFLYPGLVLMALGTAATIALLPGSREIGGVRFDVHTLFYGSLALLIGFQAVFFWLFARTFAVSEGLFPPNRRSSRVASLLTLEVALIAGLLLVAGGVAGSVVAVLHWQDRSFGDLDVRSTLRLVIPSGTLIALGLQTMLAGFFLSVLGLKRG